MPRLYDPNALQHSTPAEDLKWCSAAGAIILLVAAVILSALSALL